MKKVKQLGVEKNITILENRYDVNKLMQAMDVFIMPSLWEGIPLALIEAQAASLPCVISDTINEGIIVDEIVTRMSLDNLDEWVKTIEGLNLSEKNRNNTSMYIVKSGFDVIENVKIISDFYLSVNAKEVESE